MNGVPAVGGLEFSMAQKKLKKVPVGGKCQLGKVPVGESASWGRCHLGKVPVGRMPVGGQKLTENRTKFATLY